MAEVLLNDPGFACREPVFDLRRPKRDFGNLPKHCDRLNIAAVEPSEERSACFGGLPVHQLDHRLHPLMIVNTSQPTFIGSPYLVGAIVSPESVALMANAALNRGESAARLASLSGDTPTEARHLRWIREPSDNLPGFSS